MQRSVLVILLLAIVTVSVNARWLPTRSQDDRLARLRELLKDLLESELEEKNNYGSRIVYKREVSPTEDTELTTTHHEIQPHEDHNISVDNSATKHNYSGKVIQVMQQKLKHR